MSSALLESMGLGSLDIAYVLIGLLAGILILMILVIVQMVKLSKLKKRYEAFMKGKEAKSLEKEIAIIFEDNQLLKSAAERNKNKLISVYEEGRRAGEECLKDLKRYLENYMLT